MSRYSSDSDDGHWSKKSKSKHRHRRSKSSDLNYKQKHSQRNRSPSPSRNGSRQSSRSSYKDRRDCGKSRRVSRNSPSPSYRIRRKSYSRSRSRSRSLNHSRNKSSYAKRRYRSRSRSRSRSLSRRRHRSRSKSGSKGARSRLSHDRSDSESSVDDTCLASKDKKPSDREKTPAGVTSSYRTIISADDPIAKQEQLNEIEASSFVQKSFKSSKPQSTQIQSSVIVNNSLPTANIEHEKNDSVFHDSIIFEDSEAKLQKWVQKVYKLRQKFFSELPR